MAEMAKASDATSVLLESTELQFETAAMKIALARQMRPIRTQRSNRLGSRMTRNAASDDRGVSRTLAGRGRENEALQTATDRYRADLLQSAIAKGRSQSSTVTIACTIPIRWPSHPRSRYRAVS